MMHPRYDREPPKRASMSEGAVIASVESVGSSFATSSRRLRTGRGE